MRTERVTEFNEFLRERGIDLLTSEADGTGLRGLFDLTGQGQEILGEFLGGAAFTYEGWNDWHAKSAMLAWELIIPLCIYILFREGCDQVALIRSKEGCYANFVKAYTLETENDRAAALDEIERCREVYDSLRLYCKSGTAKNGLRNLHVMSGRTE